MSFEDLDKLTIHTSSVFDCTLPQSLFQCGGKTNAQKFRVHLINLLYSTDYPPWTIQT